jgi:hypothetical protein
MFNPYLAKQVLEERDGLDVEIELMIKNKKIKEQNQLKQDMKDKSEK